MNKHSTWQNAVRAAARFLQAAENAFQKLASMPEMASLWNSDLPSLEGMRVWPIPKFKKYLIFYWPIGNGIEVFRVLHGAQDLDRLLEG